MGLLQRRSVFMHEELKGEPSFKKGRGRKASMPSSKPPVIDKDKELPKRKSLVNILRPWKRGNEAPSVPTLPLPNAPYANERDFALSSPTSPINPLAPRPVSQVGVSQAGVCSTFPRPAYPSSVTLPNFIPGPRRFYNQGGAMDSTSSFGASRSTLQLSAQPSYAHYPTSPAPMTISGPIPGIGDVPPTRYNDFFHPLPQPPPGEIGIALAAPPHSLHVQSLGKRESRQRIRLSAQTTNTMVSGSTHTSHTSHTIHPPTSQGALAGTSPPASQSLHGESPLASNRQSTATIKPLKRQSKGSKRASEADFLLDAEVAAVFSDFPGADADVIPPVPGIPAALAALEGRSTDQPAPLMRREPERQRTSRAAVSMLPEPRFKSKIPVPQRIHSMLPVPPPRRSSALVEKSLPPPPRQAFTSLRPPPRSLDSGSGSTSSTPPATSPGLPSTGRLPAPASPRPDSLLSTASWGSSAGVRLSERLGRVGRGSIPWRDSPGGTPDLSTGSESEGVEALEDKQGPRSPRCVGDEESVRSTSSLSHCPTALLSPVSSVCATPSSAAANGEGLLSPSTSTDFGLGLGVLVPGPRNTSPTREIAGLRDRNSVLEATNSRLEAELRQVRSNPGLRSSVAASMYSISSLAVRDDISIGWTSHNGSCLDLAMPALVAEIDQLKRSGAALQAELQGLKTQVSLLLPPTPQELAETETNDGYVPGERYIPSATYALPPGRVQEVASDADDERDTPTPRRREDSLGSDLATSSESHSSAYSTSSADSSSPLTPDSSADCPALPNITELALDGKPGDRSSIISLTRGGAPLTKLPPPRGYARARSRVSPVNVSKANAFVSASDPSTPKATTPKARRMQRNSIQPPPRSAVTPRTSVFNMGTAVPPARPPRRRPVPAVAA
ncbi:hypothetical protein CC85DRAFT_322316 [Cutaneotrichosporon oleaginosum]|uniref:Uncharacterized protein n=1 Tax=Cutaneotrichosporon oleaginosum TaxID=879819 RepID=A0A0J0XG56_9TREE|nr:uncharacterized protein CC85DRAFT_322316 [Cutaneotrichosporon oleaginosum]KLT40055.1 hypothetical protein CC85DRAFT_322316 [Cutaneotrichosporon oleaginosum]